jgi:hypothetical protein
MSQPLQDWSHLQLRWSVVWLEPPISMHWAAPGGCRDTQTSTMSPYFLNFRARSWHPDPLVPLLPLVTKHQIYLPTVNFEDKLGYKSPTPFNYFGRLWCMRQLKVGTNVPARTTHWAVMTCLLFWWNLSVQVSHIDPGDRSEILWVAMCDGWWWSMICFVTDHWTGRSPAGPGWHVLWHPKIITLQS